MTRVSVSGAGCCVQRRSEPQHAVLAWCLENSWPFHGAVWPLVLWKLRSVFSPPSHPLFTTNFFFVQFFREQFHHANCYGLMSHTLAWCLSSCAGCKTQYSWKNPNVLARIQDVLSSFLYPAMSVHLQSSFLIPGQFTECVWVTGGISISSDTTRYNIESDKPQIVNINLRKSSFNPVHSSDFTGHWVRGVISKLFSFKVGHCFMMLITHSL